MPEIIKKFTESYPRTKITIGVILVIIGLLALVTPLTPGSWLVFIGAELIGLRFLAWDNIRKTFSALPMMSGKISASGTSKPPMTARSIMFAIVFLVAAVAAFSLYRISHLYDPAEIGGGVACTMDAKICPDGSAVGREGPNCEFAACPNVSTTTAYQKGDTVTVSARLNQSVTALGETITPLEVIDDSRCPTDVQCIWAGTVHVRAIVISGMGTGTIVLELGKPSTTEVNTITLENVEPAKNSKLPTQASDYRFTFKVVRR
jgi:hypothetical protein